MANYLGTKGKTLLTPRQQRFVREYMKDLRAPDAIRRTGYTGKFPRESAAVMMRVPKVRAEIARLKALELAALEVDSQRVTAEVARIAFADIRHLFDAHGVMLPPEQWGDGIAAAVASIEVKELFTTTEDGEKILTGHLKKVTLWNKPANLRLLAEALRLIGPPIQQTNVQVNVINTLNEAMQRAYGATDAEGIDGTPG